ncbi:unnamed protein product [Symbiodinium natans]|uniref:Uncharacterized protein n=1 Tax=Symbiodinium natans TaxID=878477 RepID=A0A812TTE6_9DINO|nr:unnamed protein product [Symbiodinium natans]
MKGGKPGQLVFVKVDAQFGNPTWRQGIIVQQKSKGAAAQFMIMVRAVDQASLPSSVEITMMEIESRKYMIVEGGERQLVSNVPQEPFAALEVSGATLLKEGRRWISETEDIHTATASEEPEAPKVSADHFVDVQEPSEESSSSEPSSEAEKDKDEVDDELLRLLRQAQKSSPAFGGKSASSGERKSKKDKKDKTSRGFALFEGEKTKRKSTGSGEDTLTEAMQKLLLSSAGKPDPQALQTLLMMKILSDTSAQDKGKSRNLKDTRDSSSSDSSSEDGKKLRGAARAFRRHRKAQEAMWRKPMKHVRTYTEEVETELGVEGGDKPYHLWDFTRRIPFGKQKGLFRAHFLVSHILKHLLDDDPKAAALMTVLTLRCLHQVALDGGNWEIGWALTSLKDPLARKRWGGEPAQLESAAEYLRAVQDLEKRTKQAAWWNQSQEHQETEPGESDKVWRPPGPAKGGRKGKEKGDKPSDGA